jgi:uncharacterized protein YutE (UPF0331/DUF86 family)
MRPAADPDIVLAKVSTVRACVATIRSFHEPGCSLQAWLVMDLTVLNLQRAAQACLDVANHLITANRWELPRSAGHAFEVLRDHQVIAPDLAQVMARVMGFRNIAVHDYAKLSHEIVEGIARDRLVDLERFADTVAALAPSG